MVPSQLPLFNSSYIEKSPYRKSPFSHPPNPLIQYRQDGRYVQHHGPPGRLPPRMRATPHDPRDPQLQMIDKVHQQLALGILTSLFAGIGYASSGGAKKVTGSTPPINASSKGEEDFIQYVASFVSSCLSERARKEHSRHERPAEYASVQFFRSHADESVPQIGSSSRRARRRKPSTRFRTSRNLSIRKSDRKAMEITSQSHLVCIYTLR